MANIRINDVPQRIQYVATSPLQSVFPIPYPFLANTDIVVWQDDVQLSQGGGAGQYGLMGAGTASGGTMTLVTAVTGGTIITITGETPIDRTSIYSPTISNLTGDDLNSDLNRIIIMLQELWTVQNYMQLVYKPWLELSQDITVTKDRYLPILPPLHCWVMNEANDEIIPFDVTGGGGGGGDSIIIPVIQPAHGFAKDQVVYFNGTIYVLALAINAVQGEAIGMVASVTDANNFNLLLNGQAQTNMILTTNGVYFLSDVTPGLLTLTEPTTVGHISKPLLIANGANEGVYNNMRGKIIGEEGFSWNGVVANTQMEGDQGYYTTGGAALDLTLPVTITAGTTIKVAGYGSVSWKIVQNANQVINFGNHVTTTGVVGYLQSTNANDSIELLCVVDDTTFVVLNSVGNITYN